MTKKKMGARRGRPPKKKEALLLLPAEAESLNRIQLVPEAESQQPESQPETAAAGSSSGSTEPLETSAGTDPFEAAINEVGAELGGEFAAEASAVGVVVPEETKDDDDSGDWIKEILSHENVKLYVDVPFDGAAMLLQKPHLSLKKHETALLAPLVRKWAKTLMESSESPEFAAFALFCVVYGTRVGMVEGLGELKEWMPKIKRILGLGTQTQD